MLTLEEAIKAEEAETLAYEECLNSLDDNMPTDMWNEFNKSLGKQMDYHRQLAEWLRELKAYREELPKEIKNVKVRQANVLEANAKNENYNPYLAEYIKGYLCGLSYTEGIIAKIIGEVNADGET